MKGMGGVTLGMAGSVFLASALVLVASVVDALRVGGDGEALAVSAGDEAPVASHLSEAGAGASSPAASPVSGATGQGALRGIVYPRVTGDEILDAVNQDPFHPSRTPSPDRYLLPSERSAATTGTRVDPRRRGPELRLVGAAVGGDLGVAMIQVDDAAPLALLTGEFIEGYQLALVGEENAVLEGESETLILPLMAQLEPRRTSSQRDRGGAAPAASSAQPNPRDMEALQQRVQEILQGAMGRGGGMGMGPGGGMGARFQEIMESVPGPVVIRGGEATVQVPPPTRGTRGGGGGLLP
jgi:hypothetical protein